MLLRISANNSDWPKHVYYACMLLSLCNAAAQLTVYIAGPKTPYSLQIAVEEQVSGGLLGRGRHMGPSHGSVTWARHMGASRDLPRHPTSLIADPTALTRCLDTHRSSHQVLAPHFYDSGLC